MPEYRKVCKVDEVPLGEARMYVVDGLMLGIFHTVDGYFALDNRCPHAGASLAGGFLEENTIRCRIHHWRFCVRDGTYLDEDKPRFNARAFPVRVVGDDVLVEF
ncbi:MAG: Rieske (2Fe-2S) protein [Planctomycetaceae bacterium]|nr:Rieske (2Fe-2S) protein [Planctomycetaceae bacterium]